METNQVIKAIETERAYQDKRWTNPQSSVAEYILYMQHHLNKAASAISSSEALGVHNSVMAQIRKVTALGVACGEQHGMPLRPGYEGAFLFIAGDVIDSDGILYQCICSDSKQAVFARAVLTPEGVLTVYENVFVVFNFENSDFTFQRVSLDDITKRIEFITQNYSC
jgi:hypothetical protein